MPTIYCRYVKTNGRRCCSYALRGKALCYFHAKANAHLRAVRPNPAEEVVVHSMQLDRDKLQREPVTTLGSKSAPLTLDFPTTLEDAESIQTSLAMLIVALGQNRIDPKRAAPILYGLQVASQNVSRLTTYTQTQVVRETTIDETGTELALDEDPIEIIESRQTQAAIEREEAEEEAQRRREEGDYEGDDEDESTNEAQYLDQPHDRAQPSISQLRHFLLE